MVNAQHAGALEPVAENLLNARDAERCVVRITLAQPRHEARQAFQIAPGRDPTMRGIVEPLDQFHATAPREIAVIQPPALRDERLSRRVAPPVGRDEIHAAIFIEVARRHARPPAGEFLKSLSVGRNAGDAGIPRRKFPAFVAENFQRTPVTGKQQIRVAITIEVGEGSPIHQSDGGETTRVLLIEREALGIAAKDHRGRGFRETSRHEPSTDEEIQLSVAIHIRQGQRAGTRAERRKKIPRRLARERPGTDARAILHRRGEALPGQQPHLPVAGAPREHGGLRELRHVCEGTVQLRKAAASVVAKRRERSAATTGDD